MNAIVSAPQASTVASAPDTFLALIERVAKDPTADVEKLERLLDMRAQEFARIAALHFHEAMTACQTELEPIRANCTNPQTRSRYADLAAVDAAIRPTYSRHGFSLSFSTDDTERPDHVRVICRVYHRDGHTETHRIDMPADGKGARGNDVMTKTHAAASAVSYGRRYITLMIFNLMIDRDDDGNTAGRCSAPPAARPTPGRHAGGQEPPYDPITGEIKEAANTVTQDFKHLRESLRQVKTWAELGEWYNTNKECVRGLPEDLKGEVTKFYCTKRDGLRPAEAAE